MWVKLHACQNDCRYLEVYHEAILTVDKDEAEEQPYRVSKASSNLDGTLNVAVGKKLDLLTSVQHTWNFKFDIYFNFRFNLFYNYLRVKVTLRQQN